MKLRFPRTLAALSAALLLAAAPSSASPALDQAAALLPELSYEELVMLKDKINLAMWQSDDWQEVTVPEGYYRVGEDIPAGTWNIHPAGERDYLYISRFSALDTVSMLPMPNSHLYDRDLRSGKSSFGDVVPYSVDFELLDGWWFHCSGAVVFTPPQGKPDLGFKK